MSTQADAVDPVGTPDRRHGWRVGAIAGTPVYIGRSWPVILVLLVVIVVPNRLDGGLSVGEALLVAAASAVLLLVSVLVHEAAHALVARQRGHRVDRIVADVWGGHTVYDSLGATPMTTALVAVVGPLANLALAGAAWLAMSVAGDGLVLNLLGAVTYTNLFVGLFNLLPGLPLDGGHIVSSLVWRATGRQGAGLRAAGWFGRIVAVGTMLWFVARPLLMGDTPSLVAIVWAALIGLFLWRGASSAIQAGEIHEATTMPALAVVEPLVVVPGTTSLAAVDQGLTGAPGTWVAAANREGWPFGLLDPTAHAAVPGDVRAATSLAAVVAAQPVNWVVTLPAGAVLTELVRVMSERSLSFAVVVDDATREVRGLATAERLNQVIGTELARRRRR